MNRFSLPRLLKLIGLILMAVLILILVAVIVYRYVSMPRTTGQFHVPVSAQVTVSRDGHGVPSIKASQLNDAWFAMGYVHAQDRLWQMEMQRRIVAGRLSEILGPASLDTDKFLRTLGVRRAATKQYNKLDAPSKEALNQYAKGVNAATSQMLADGPLPPEFVMLGVKPEPWEPIDSVGWSMMMAWDLGSNWTSELMRMQLSKKLNVNDINQVLPLLSAPPGPIRDYAALYKSLGLNLAMEQGDAVKLATMQPLVGIEAMEGVGSNNWALAGSRTVSGKPLLANDPHLGLQAPSLWYLANIDAGGFQLSGGTLPGLPYIVIGRNQYVSWGFTTTGADVQDLYLERFNPSDMRALLGPDGLETTELFLETIKVKGQKDVPLNVRASKRGPIISDVHEPSRNAIGEAGFGISLRWTALDEGNLTITAGLNMNTAKSAAEFENALRNFFAPVQNIVFADDAGNIGFITAGAMPVRSAANDLHGLAPAPAWESKYQWQGYIPFEQLPREMNPARGYIVTANNNILPEGYTQFVTAEWALPFRAQRIAQLIEATTKHDAQSMKAMQGDVQSLVIPALMRSAEAGGALTPQTELGNQALELLKKFDGVMSTDKPEPLIVNAWQQQLARKIFGDEVGAQDYESLIMGRRDGLAGSMLALATGSAMCDNKTTPAVETCPQIAAQALDAAMANLAQNYGSNISKWRWGEAHLARSEHRPFGKQALLAKVFNLHVPTPGDANTVNVGRPANKPNDAFTSIHSGSLRAVFDMASPQASWLMQSTGQSGHRLSSHYADLMPLWAADKFLDMSEAKSGSEVLMLVP